MKVFAVSQGMVYEGLTVEAIFDSFDKAKTYASEQVKDFQGYVWSEEEQEFFNKDTLMSVSIEEFPLL